jgi:hypothetical protein
MNRRRVRRVAVALFVLVALSIPAAAASATLSSSSSSGAVEAGETVKVTFELTNDGDETENFILDVTSVPDDWEIVDRTDDGGTWSENNRAWRFTSVDGSALDPSETVSPSLTFRTDSPGEYTVAARADSEDGTEDTTATNVTVEPESTPTPTPTDGDDGGLLPTPTDDDSTPTPTDGGDDSTPAPTATDGSDSPSGGSGDSADAGGGGSSTLTAGSPASEGTATPTGRSPTPTSDTPTAGGGASTATDDSVATGLRGGPMTNGLVLLALLAAAAIAVLMAVYGSRVLGDEE